MILCKITWGAYMKKLFISLIFLIPFISGCAKIDANLSINNNKSADIQVKMLSDKHARPEEIIAMQATVSAFIDKSYTIKDDSTVKKVNITAKKNVRNLIKNDLDLSSLGFATKHESGRYIEVKHNFLVTLYDIDMIYNLKAMQKKLVLQSSDESAAKSVLKPEYFQKYGDDELLKEDSSPVSSDFIDNYDDNFSELSSASKQQNTKEIDVDDDYNLFDINNLEAKFTITLPAFASYNNASETDFSTYSWVLSKSEPTEIKLQYIVYSPWAIAFILLLGIAFFVYIARRIHKHETLKRIGNNN